MRAKDRLNILILLFVFCSQSVSSQLTSDVLTPNTILVDFNGTSFINNLEGNIISYENPYLDFTSLYQCSFNEMCFQNITDKRGILDSYYGAIAGNNVCGYEVYKKANVSHQGAPLYEDYNASLDCMGELNINYGIFNKTHVWCNDSRNDFGFDNYIHVYDSFVINELGARIFFIDSRVIGFEENYYFDWVKINSLSSAVWHGKDWRFKGFELQPYEILQLAHVFKPCHMQTGFIQSKFYELFFRDRSGTPKEDLNLALETNTLAVLDPWADSNFPWCENITITKAGGDLTDFPAYINVSDGNYSQFYSKGCNDGGTLLKSEVENYTDNTQDIWVKTNINGTVISRYYNASTPASNDVINTWNNNYKGIWHFSSGSNNLLDSTSNNNNGINTGSSSSTGYIDGGQYFDGNDYINISNSASLQMDGGLVTLEQWFNTTSLDKMRLMFKYDISTGSPYSGYGININEESNKMSMWVGGGAMISSTTNVNDGNTYYGVGVYNGSHTLVYINGVLETATIQTDNLDSSVQLLFGVYKPGEIDDQFFIGTIDEFRISDVVRSADWINQSYQMIVNQNTFVTFGIEETITTTSTTTTILDVSGTVYNFEGEDARECSQASNDTTEVLNFIHILQEGSTDMIGDLLALAVLLMVATVITSLFTLWKGVW